MDPNKARFKKVVRIFAFKLRFIKKLQKKQKICQPSIAQKTTYPGILSDKEITAFVKKNLSNKKNIKISFQKDGILYYKGRILTAKKINASCELSTIAKDLCSNTLCVPVIYKYSPLAYSIVNEIQCHSDAVKHSGVETVWRYVLKLGYITQNRDLVKEVKKNCERCRYLRKKAISIKMGLVSTHNLRIAPAFYATEVDLCGPFKAHSPKSKRKTIKIWLAVYCCMSFDILLCLLCVRFIYIVYIS